MRYYSEIARPQPFRRPATRPGWRLNRRRGRRQSGASAPTRGVHGTHGSKRLRPAAAQQAAVPSTTPRRCTRAGRPRPRTRPANLTRFAAWLVANKYATEYQASLLVRGHADGFFLNDYKILDRLGKGRMAGVYKAQHRLGQVFAIKVLPPSRASEPNLLGRFQREAKLAMRLKHPNVVRAFQVGQSRRPALPGHGVSGGRNAGRRAAAPQEAAAGRGGAAGLPGAAGLAAHPHAGAGPPRPEAGQPDAGRRRRRHDGRARRSSCWTSAWAG